MEVDLNRYTALIYLIGTRPDLIVVFNLDCLVGPPSLNYDDCEVTVGLEGIMTGDAGRITWEFDVEETGFYNLELGYIIVCFPAVRKKISGSLLRRL